MSLQKIVSTAVNIEINRSKLVAQSLSRSGRLLTASRNWANPYRFSITPKPVWEWNTTTQGIFATLFDNDRYQEDSFYLTEVNGGPMEWITQYKGTLDTNSNDQLDNMLVASEPTGASIAVTYSGDSSANAGRYIVRKGDWIRPADHRYAYQATADQQIVSGTSSYTITTHRGWIAQGGYTATGKAVNIGDAAARFYVQVTKLPQMRFINKNLVELNGNIELIEVVL